MHELTAAIAFACLASAGCYNYTPPRPAAGGRVVAPPGDDDPGAIRIATKTFGAEDAAKSAHFTFVDGAGRELTQDELADRYERVVGEDGVTDTFERNHLVASLTLLGGSSGLVGLEALGVDECERSTCTAKTKGDLVLAGAITALVVGATLFEMLGDSKKQAMMTRGQAEALVSRYEAARGRSHSGTVSESRASRRGVVGTPLSFSF